MVPLVRNRAPSMPYPGPIQRLSLSIACVIAGGLLVCAVFAIWFRSADAFLVSMIYLFAYSPILWVSGVWIAVLALPQRIQLRWWTILLYGVQGWITGYLLWEYRNAGAVVYPPRTLWFFWQAGALQAFYAALYVLGLRWWSRRGRRPEEASPDFPLTH